MCALTLISQNRVNGQSYILILDVAEGRLSIDLRIRSLFVSFILRSWSSKRSSDRYGDARELGS